MTQSGNKSTLGLLALWEKPLSKTIFLKPITAIMGQ